MNCVLLRARQNKSGKKQFPPSFPPEHKGIDLQIPNCFISVFQFGRYNKWILVLLTVREVVSHLKSTNQVYCIRGIRVCPLCSLVIYTLDWRISSHSGYEAILISQGEWPFCCWIPLHILRIWWWLNMLPIWRWAALEFIRFEKGMKWGSLIRWGYTCCM